MSWLSNQTTWVRCDSPKHVGDPIFRMEISYAANLRTEMKKAGWGYDHAKDYHQCPTCVTRTILSN